MNLNELRRRPAGESPRPRQDDKGVCNPNVGRRAFLRMAIAALAAPTAASFVARLARASADPTSWRHGLSLLDELRYPPEFRHFAFVDPTAPKRGLVRQSVIGTYDNFNIVVAGVKGVLGAGVSLLHETLLIPSLDEVSSEYGLLAEAVNYPADFSSVTYRLRAEARWHDGLPITPRDVIFSFNVFKSNDPRTAMYYRHVTKAEPTGEREVTFSFDAAGNRELPQIVGQLTVLPEHWWTASDTAHTPRRITETTLEAPLGSGPYRIKHSDPGRTIVLERVPNYWGKNLNVRVGQNNFDELRFEYFRDAMVAFEAFKAGELDWHIENSAKTWATAYGFPAVREKRVVLEEFPIRNMGIMQAFAFNVRRRKFAQPQLRRAFNFAFDFEGSNQDLFDGQYKRIASYFEGTELACSGLPQGQELQILEKLRDQLPADVFTTAYWNPVGGSEGTVRNNLREAMHLAAQAGFVIRGSQLVSKETGEPLSVEFLLNDPIFERVVLPYKLSLERLGIAATVRTVDNAQYENRLRQRDFDIVVASWAESLSPGNEQREFWGTRAADM